jgi:hypothetical protein
MMGSKLLLIVSLLTGVFAEECDITAADIESFAEKVTVTNASPGSTASVIVTFDHGEQAWRMPGGQSRTASSLLAATYSVSVIGPESSRWMSYREQLEQARDELVKLSLSPDASGDHVTNAAAGLVDVVGALSQLGQTDFIQECSGKIESGVEVHATVTSTRASDGTRLWVLDCG